MGIFGNQVLDAYVAGDGKTQSTHPATTQKINWGEVISEGFMAFGEGMTGQPFLTGYRKLKQDAEQANQASAIRIAKEAEDLRRWEAEQAAQAGRFQFEQTQQAQKDGYVPIEQYYSPRETTPGWGAKSLPSPTNRPQILPIPGVGEYAKPATYSDKLEKLKMEAQTAYYNANAQYLNAITGQMGGKGGGGTQLVYRDPVSGQEVPEEQALADIESGMAKYVVNQRQFTKAGPVEKPVVKPDQLTEGERNYITGAKVALESLGNLKSGYDTLSSMKGSKDWKSFQAMNLPAWAISNKNIEMFQSDLDSLKGQVPFLRGGKALTENESRRIDVLLNPFGKDKQRYEKDIKKFEDEFMGGEKMAMYGLSRMGMPPKKNDDFSSMSDEELRKIANGGK